MGSQTDQPVMGLRDYFEGRGWLDNRGNIQPGEAAGLMVLGAFATFCATVTAVAVALFRHRYRITRR